ncbi:MULTISPECIES: Com family DNA-binding transcriptional regulator [Snodgrassella]|nr:Com family DNA-binding transcriptional regulator [Snodgrassella sp. B3088]MCX8749216.1 Com family DNA-binding transcriptional regulator [Snodgrassella sp. B3088]
MFFKILRCQSCNRKLAEVEGIFRILIKCNRCKVVNNFKITN